MEFLYGWCEIRLEFLCPGFYLCPRNGGVPMLDMLFIPAGLGLFLAALALTALCDRL
jgi:hypothetical protein